MMYRGRIAPSPTGLLHLGHAATFWTAHQRAVAAGGVLVLRMEDLDPQRSRPEYVQAAVEDLTWLGVRWQEGPDFAGPYSPYCQSQRHSHYRAALERLMHSGSVYPCSCTRKELATMTQAPHGEDPVYSGACRPVAGSSPQPRSNLPPRGTNWRFRVPDGVTITFHDGQFGEQDFVAGRDFGDFLVWRRDDVPAYQLAVAVDDAAMQITEVVRGADLLLATARQLLLCRALGLPEPLWHHCPLVADSDGRRLAKRNNALSVRELRASGIKPFELLNMAAAQSRQPQLNGVRTYGTGELDVQKHRS